MSDNENENVEIVYVTDTESEKEEEIKETETIEEPEPEPEPVKEKPKRKKREMTPERKAILLENLRRGRETASKNRKKKALARKLKKQEKEEEIDDFIQKSIEKKNKTKQIFNDYEDLKKRYDILNNEYTEYRRGNRKPIQESKPIKTMDNDDLKPIMEEIPINEVHISNAIHTDLKNPTIEKPKIPSHKVSLWDL